MTTKGKRKKTTTTTEAPPLVYFPDGDKGECGDFGDPGFNTYGFVGFLLGVVNIVSQVSKPPGNNAGQENSNTVSIPPGMGGRKKRELEDEVEREWRERHRQQLEEEVLVADVALLFLKTYWTLSKGPVECAERVVCEVNKEVVRLDTARESDESLVLAEVFAEIFTSALESWSPAATSPTPSLSSAGDHGRSEGDCLALSPQCSKDSWDKIRSFSQEELSLDLSFLKEGERDLFQHVSNNVEFSKLGLPDIATVVSLLTDEV
ncbi:hypothetical protein C7M84_002991 [Penaeus vannamei]|uniref:Uncharacterized protein n=1 Tax=Penaeus vannamei TaxID=6689 RepID=A0A3R7SWA8_PENVA|nr:hypothetical protein C7M84_002991 [Penaeus vannamei]